jgi:Ala-tRNA(Pro) deacylase
MTTLTPSGALLSVLDASHVSYEVIAHRRTMSAAAEARAIGVKPSHVAKTLVLATEPGFVRAVVPASARVDLRKVRAALESDEVRLATEPELVGAYPEFELGAVPPVGGAEDRVVVDLRVDREPSVTFEAGTHDLSVRMKAADLVSLANARVADICAE